jgi:hypothetical protein
MAKLSPDTHLSGSVLPAYMGFSPYQTAFDVLDRARAAIQGQPREELDSLPADIGTAVESTILKRGLRKLGLDWQQMQHYTEDGQEAAKKHPDLELYYSDDGIIELSEPMKVYADESQGDPCNEPGRRDRAARQDCTGGQVHNGHEKER